MAKVKSASVSSNEQRISAAMRENMGRDQNPKWAGHEAWSDAQYMYAFRAAMNHYNLEHSAKTLKPAVLKWMASNGYTKEQLELFKKIKDWRCHSTMGAIASCFLRGMPASRPSFNHGRDGVQWLKDQIAIVFEDGKYDVEPEETREAKAGPALSIQDRVREASLAMTEEIENALDIFNENPDDFDPKAFKVLNLLKGKQAKAAHARIIREFYGKAMNELEEVVSGKADEQLKEAYSHRSKKQLRVLVDFYKEINSACTMLMEEAKVTRKPRARKAVSKDKVVEKLKYKKTDDTLRLVSINPTDLIGKRELWVFNSKTRKLGKYIAAEFQELNVKGTTITGYDESKSVQKTLRKPAEQLKAFKDAGKVGLRKFLEDINAVDTQLSGRINEDVLLLKVQ